MFNWINKIKSKQYAQSVIDSFGVNGVPCGSTDIKQMIAEGYLAGATEALASQWKRPEEETPTSSHVLALIRTDDGCQLEIANWFNGTYQGNMAMSVNLGQAKVVAWMEIPEMK